MSLEPSKKSLSRLEFILLMAAMSALDAFSIDAMLPALNQIGIDLKIVVENDRQLVVTFLYVGFSMGVLVYGFVADRYGRRLPILIGFIIYVIGTLTCIFADTLVTLLSGRILQGIGAAGPYVLSIAIVRDSYRGPDMAQILSLIMVVFIGVPMIAPFIGQGIMLISDWRSIFIALGIYAVFVGSWFAARQPESLVEKDKKAWSLKEIRNTILEVVSHYQSVRYMLALGALTGAFIAYLGTAQQIFQNIYHLGDLFAVTLALLAALFGIASYLNSRLVHQFGEVRLIHFGLLGIIVFSILYLVLQLISNSTDGLWVFLGYIATIIFCFGFLFGNVMTMAMDPMEHIAGAASSIITAISTVIGVVLAITIGSQLEGNVLPVVVGFGVLASIAMLLNNKNPGNVKPSEAVL